MNKKMVFYMVGQIIKLEAVLMILPMIVSLFYRENLDALVFLGTILAAAAIGFSLTAICKKAERTIFAKEGFVIVSIAWLALSAIGALPFAVSGAIPSYVDAFFETVSGFTTTGASIVPDIESMNHGLLFWRSFTHWIGGMGILVLMMAILPDSSGRSIFLMRAEMPGPVVDKIVPRVKNTAKILYFIYLALTMVQVIFLLCGGLSLFESFICAFGTAGTGGFSMNADGLAGYSSYLQWVVTIFMLIFGVNFNLYYLFLTRKGKSAIKSEELWTYIGIVVTASVIIAINIFPTYGLADSVKYSAFQVASIMTTTGYATMDFSLWPNLSKTVLLVLMLIGGCAGSTAGGLKVSRIIILFKNVVRELKTLLHPRAVTSTRFEGKKLDDRAANGIGAYLALYAFMLVGIILAISFEPFGIETNLSAAISCFNNVGPGLAAVGPMANYSAYSDFSKIVLSFAMLFGRLELYPLLLTLNPATWNKK